GVATARFTRENFTRTIFLRSRDRGRSWDYVSTALGNKPPDHLGFTEPDVKLLPNGEIVCVARTEYHLPDRILVQARSADDGLTWSEPTAAPGVAPHYPVRFQRPLKNYGKLYLGAANVTPFLLVLKNGIVVLSYGRPGVKVAFSKDGTAKAWTD